MLKTLYHKYLNNRSNKIMKLACRKSNTKITLMKAYAIIAVVCSHCNGGGVVFPMSNWLPPSYFFMPLFLFTSGFFYREETDTAKFFPFLKSKLLAFVLPYFGWNIFYGIANYSFRSAGVINYGDPITFYSLFVRPWIDGHQYVFNIPSWFLLSFFIDVMVIFMIRKILYKFRILNDPILLAFTFALSLMCIYFSQKGYNTGFGLCFLRAGFLLPYFQLGYFYKKHEHFFTYHKTITIAVLFVIMYISWIMAGEQGARPNAVFAKFTGNPLIITVLTMSGILLTATVCDILAPAFEKSRIVHMIGDNTFTIMMHHGFIIFLINFALYLLTYVTDLASFDILKFKSTIWYAYPWRDARIYIVYMILGIFAPLLLKWCSDKLILRLRDKHNLS